MALLQVNVDITSLVSSTANVIAARARHTFGILQSDDNPEHRLACRKASFHLRTVTFGALPVKTITVVEGMS